MQMDYSRNGLTILELCDVLTSTDHGGAVVVDDMDIGASPARLLAYIAKNGPQTLTQMLKVRDEIKLCDEHSRKDIAGFLQDLAEGREGFRESLPPEHRLLVKRGRRYAVTEYAMNATYDYHDQGTKGGP